MKISKLITSVMAAALSAALLALPAAAEDETPVYTEPAGESTFCFDSDASLSMWETYGSAEETGLKYEITLDPKESGAGSLCVSEKFTEALDSEQKYGGVFITADKLGLESFQGCTIQMSFMFDSAASGTADEFTIFSDGVVWVPATVSAENNGRWSKISLTVPENAKNERAGFQIPVFTPYTGNVVYVDNVKVYDAEGNMIANIGDNKEAADTVKVSIGSGGRVVWLIVLVVIIVAVIAGIGFVITKVLKKFT